MDYELAKQLKDAGWPQAADSKGTLWKTGGSYLFPEGTTLAASQEEMMGIIAYAPTLSELVEASGDKLDILERTRGGFRQVGLWVARTLKLGPLAGAFYGDTPEEAVARLWLALNAKGL